MATKAGKAQKVTLGMAERWHSEGGCFLAFRDKPPATPKLLQSHSLLLETSSFSPSTRWVGRRGLWKQWGGGLLA